MQCKNSLNDVDVICQHTCKGDIIPLRIRVMDEDGEYHIYNIKSYKDLSNRGTYTTCDGIFVTNHIHVFECKIIIFGNTKTVRLYYDMQRSIWKMN